MGDETKSADRTAIWAVVVLTGFALTAVTILAALGRPLDSIVQLVVMLVPTAIGSLLTLLRVEKVSSDMKVVREQTNGNISKLLEKIPHGGEPLTHAIDALGTAATAATTPVTTAPVATPPPKE